jgi:ACS family D-galactonate transporter-like MFS transporter
MATTDTQKQGVSTWLVALLALAMFINYADRGSLAVAAPVLSHDLAIGPRSLGILLSSFFWTYALVQPLSGAVVQRWPVRWVLPAGLLAWSVATMACGAATGFGSLLMLRMAIGMGESVIFPANARILAEHAAEHQRGRANAAISIGLFLGPVAGTLVGGLLLARFGWRPVFWVIGSASVLWLPLWFLTRLPGDKTPRAAPLPVPGWGEILSHRALWGIAIGQFCYAYPTYLLLTWLPTFLVSSEHYSLQRMAVVGAAIAVGQAFGSGFSGIMSDRWIAKGHDASAVRKLFLVGGMACTGLTFVGATLAPHETVVMWLAATAVFCGMISPLNFGAGQTLAGPAAAGRWMGMQNLIGNMSGIAAPLVTGIVVAQTGSFRIAFLIPAVLAVIGLIAYGPLTGPIRRVAWRTAAC